MTENDLTDLTPQRISMTPIEFEWFEKALNEEPKDMPKLRALMHRPTVWVEEPCS